MSRSASRLTGQNVRGLHYPLYDSDLRATHARTLLPAALASVSFGFVLVRVRVRSFFVVFAAVVWGRIFDAETRTLVMTSREFV